MIRKEVTQRLDRLCEQGEILLGWKYVEAIRIAAIFYETGEDTATEEKNCKNCEHGFDSEDCYKCDKNIQNTCEPNQTATEEGE